MTEQDILRLKIGVDSADANRRLQQFGSAVSQTAATSASGLGRLTANFGALKAGIAGLAIGATIGQLNRLAETMDDISDQSRAFEFFASRAQLANDTLKRLGEATGREVSRMDLMRLSSELMAREIADTTDELERIVAAAHGAGEALGVDSVQAIEALIGAAGSLTERQLAQLGTTLPDLEKGYKRLASQLGKTVAELDDTEKRTVFVAQAMERLEGVASSVADRALTFSSMWLTGVTEVKDAWSSFIDDVNTAPEKVASGFAGLLRLMPGSAVLGMSGIPKDAFEPPAPPPTGPQTGTLPSFVLDADELRRRMGPVELDTLPTRPPPGPFPMEPFRTFPDEIGAPDFDALLAQAERERELAEEQSAARIEAEEAAQETLLGVRLAGAEQWGATAEELEVELIEARYDREIEALEALGADTAALKTAQEQEIAQIEDEYARQREARAKQEARFKRDQHMLVAQAALTAMAAIFPRSKPIQYALAIINTARAVSEALPNIPLAALVAAQGLMQIRTIQSASVGGGGSVSAPGGAVPPSEAGGRLGQPGGTGDLAGGMTVHVFIEGQGFVQDTSEFARMIAREIEQQQGRAGEA